MAYLTCVSAPERLVLTLVVKVESALLDYIHSKVWLSGTLSFIALWGCRSGGRGLLLKKPQFLE
jgi:hypothetical protein